MKKLFVSLLAILAISLSVAAQDSTKTKKDQLRSMKAAYKGDKKDHRKEMKDLNLSEDQKQQMIANREEARTQKEAIQKDNTLTDAEKNTKIAELKKQQKEKKESVLTPDQKDKLDQIKQKNKEEEKQHAERKNAEIKSQLGLSDDQAAQLKQQQKANHAKLKAIKTDPTLDEAGKRKQMKELKASSQAQRKAVLTPDQQKKMDDLKKEEKSNKAKATN